VMTNSEWFSHRWNEDAELFETQFARIKKRFDGKRHIRKEYERETQLIDALYGWKIQRRNMLSEELRHCERVQSVPNT